MEDRLKFHDNNRVKRAREIRKRNKRKRRLWVGFFVMLILIFSIYQLDKRGYFEVIFEKSVTYSGTNEYFEPEASIVKRDDIAKMAQLLINHPYKFGSSEVVKGIPVNPIDAAGFVDWVYYNLSGKILSAQSTSSGPATTRIWDASTPVMESELKVGDIGFYEVPENNRVNHIGIYIGEIDGNKVFIHAGGINFKADGLDEGRIVVSYNNSVKKNNKDTYGNKFTPAAESTQFLYYRRPKLDIID